MLKLKSVIIAIFSITLILSPLAQAKGGGSSSRSMSSKSYSFGGSPSPRSNSFFSKPAPRSTPAPIIHYESRKSDALVQKGDAGTKFYSTKKMEQDMASAGIKQKESVIATNKALNSMNSQPKQTTPYNGYAYTKPTPAPVYGSTQPRTVIVEKHYHNDNGPGLGTIIAGNMIGNALSRPHTSAPVIINNGGGVQNQGVGNYPNQYQQNCSVFDGNCITSRFHFVNGIDF